MKSHRGKRRFAPLLGAVLALIVGVGTVYAYWTFTGSGAGTGTAATGNQSLTVKQVTVLTAMYPGDSAQTLNGKFDNPNSGPIYVSTVSVSVSSVDKAVGAAAGTCDATDFTIAGSPMTVNAEIPVGTDQGAWSGATIKFNNKASNQDACKGATVHLAYAIP